MKLTLSNTHTQLSADQRDGKARSLCANEFEATEVCSAFSSNGEKRARTQGCQMYRQTRSDAVGGKRGAIRFGRWNLLRFAKSLFFERRYLIPPSNPRYMEVDDWRWSLTSFEFIWDHQGNKIFVGNYHYGLSRLGDSKIVAGLRKFFGSMNNIEYLKVFE